MSRFEFKSRERALTAKRKLIESRTKQSLKKALDLRSVELGVVRESKVLRANYVKPQEGLVHLQEDSEFEKELLSVVFHTHHKSISALFKEYTGLNLATSFEDAQHSKQLLREG